MEHLTQQHAIDYISEKMEEDMLFSADLHLATCERCVGRVRALRLLRANLDKIWDSWSAASHAGAYIEAQIAQALSGAAEAAKSPALRDRMQSWLGKIQMKAETALGIVLDTSNRTADIVSEGLGAMSRPNSILSFQPVRVSVAGTGEKAPSSISVRADGPPWAQVNVNTLSRTVTVEFELRKEPWPLLLFMSKTRDRAPVIGELKKQNGYLFAEFRDVPDGEYVLLVEPLD